MLYSDFPDLEKKTEDGCRWSTQTWQERVKARSKWSFREVTSATGARYDDDLDNGDGDGDGDGNDDDDGDGECGGELRMIKTL